MHLGKLWLVGRGRPKTSARIPARLLKTALRQRINRLVIALGADCILPALR